MTTVPPQLTPGAPIMLVGQAPADHEVVKGRPFVGPAGRELDSWLVAAGLAQAKERQLESGRWIKWVPRDHLAITNVWLEPLAPGGLQEMTATLREAKAEGWETVGTPLSKGRYLRPRWQGCIERLQREVDLVRPTLLVAFGNEALWALSGQTGIEALRGAWFESRFGPKAIATFHPSAILRGGYRYRPLAIADLVKARDGQHTPTIDWPHRELWLDPTLEDLRRFDAVLQVRGTDALSIDIETAKGEITSVAFAPSPFFSLCVPFSFDDRSYWPTAAHEVAAWEWVKRWCESPFPKLLQNGLYDAQWLWEKRGIALRNYLHDTRLAHHALFPELPKSLGFMGSLWAQERAWKMLAARHGAKRDD